MAGAIVVVEPEGSRGAEFARAPVFARFKRPALACGEVLGRSVLGRVVENLQLAGIDPIALVGKGPLSHHVLEQKKGVVASNAWSVL